MRYELTPKGKFALATVSITFVVLVAVVSFALSSPSDVGLSDTQGGPGTDIYAPSVPATGNGGQDIDPSEHTLPTRSGASGTTSTQEVTEPASDLETDGSASTTSAGHTESTTRAATEPASNPSVGTTARPHTGTVSHVALTCSFDTGSTHLNDDALATIVDAYAAYQIVEDAVVMVEGFASASESASNPDLAGARVAAVVTELVRLGVPKDSIVALYQPSEGDGTSAAQQRVDIYVAPRDMK